MRTLSPFSRSAAVATLALLAGAAAPARAQVFTPANGARLTDVQSLNLAGGGTYIEGLWAPYARLRVNNDTAPAGGMGVTGADFRGTAQPSFGVEARVLLNPVVFVTGEYRYNRYDELRLRSGAQESQYQDIGGKPSTETYRGGLGLRLPQTPFYARGEYSGLRFDADNGGTRENGFGVFGGAAQPITHFLGARGEAGYQDLGGAGRGFAWQAGLNLNLTPLIALTGGYRSTQLRDRGSQRGNTRLEQATVGLRLQLTP